MGPGGQYSHRRRSLFSTTLPVARKQLSGKRTASLPSSGWAIIPFGRAFTASIIRFGRMIAWWADRLEVMLSNLDKEVLVDMCTTFA